MSGVAKSASEAANSSRNALASPGTASGSVTVRNICRRLLPRLKAISSRLPPMPDSTGRKREIGDREVGQRLGRKRAGKPVDVDALETREGRR